MRPVNIAVVLVVAGMLAVGYRLQKSRDARLAALRPPPPASRVSSPGATAPRVDIIVTQSASAPAPEPRDDAEIRRQIEDGAKGTYIKDMLAQEPMLLRWAPRRLDALKVWIEPQSDVKNWNPMYPRVAERAFDQWHEAGFPLVFEFQRDSTGAEIQIRWATRLVAGGRQIGITRKSRNQDGWIVHAEIEIATFDGMGNALTPETVGGVARHEIGHALGLGHSASRDDVMYPESTTPIISAADRATLHLIYTVPPGVVK